MKRLKWTIAVLGFCVVMFSLLAGTYVFSSVIDRKPGVETTRSAHDPVSQTMEQYTQFGSLWLSQPYVQRLSLSARDGVLLQGYFVPAAQRSNELVILVHGYGVDARMMTPYAEMYRTMGYNVFLADDRGHGKSQGKYVGMGWLDRLDYLQWVDLLLNKLGPNTQIVLHGVSMGGATVMMMSGEKLPPQIKCIVEDAGYTSASAEIGYQIGHSFHLPAFPLEEVASLESRVFAGYSFEQASALKQVEKSKTPILFIHGGSDTFNPTSMVYQLYGNAGCEKELLVVPGAMHALSFHTSPVLYRQTVQAFTNKHIQIL